MLETFLAQFSPAQQAFLAGVFTWGFTAVGAAFIFLFQKVNDRLMDTLLGFSGGIMIAAGFWSLLNPAISIAKQLGHQQPWLPVAIGFLAGGFFLRMIDLFLPHLHLHEAMDKAEGVHTSWQRSVLLILAITLHNIPEGLALGVAFGAVTAGLPSATLAGAIAITIGLAIQDIPEGLAVASPLRREGFSRWKSFWYGQISGIVEPVAAVIGAVVVVSAQYMLPYALSFAAGAMMYVVVEEVIPESQSGDNADLATIGTMVGFALMMILDIGLVPS